MSEAVAAIQPKQVFVLADTNTEKIARSIAGSLAIDGAKLIVIPAGDVNKNLESLSAVWQALTDARATRHDLLINVGGGMVTDLGGFAAATYKRGMPFVNVPTTLLGAVDAAVGGKTGINFGGYKNQVGAFAPAREVIISSVFFKSLPQTELLSGYAEMVKHGLLTSAAEFRRLAELDILAADDETMLGLLRTSVQVKEGIVAQDPTEKGLRKALNLGHTVGHAFEELAMERRRPVPHGYAVAWGLVAMAVLSKLTAGLDSETLNRLAAFVRANYNPASVNGPALSVTCDDYPTLLSLMRSDKKNADADHITFTLLSAPGHPLINQVVDAPTIQTALDITRDLLGL